MAVIGLYHPLRLRGRLLKWLAGALVSSGLSNRLGCFRGDSTAEVEWLRASAEAGCVGFLGCNPAHGPRCILGGILPGSGERFVAKLGFDESAGAIRREGMILAGLSGRFKGVIRPLGMDEGGDWVLLRLPYLGDHAPLVMQDEGVAGLLGSWLGSESDSLGENAWAARLLRRVPESAVAPGWHERMRARVVRRALVHGDFAVWNLRIVEDGLCALDWEWAEESGVAGVDLAHGLRQESFMVRGMTPRRAVSWMLEEADKAPWRGYLEEAGWAGALEDWLVLGLLHSHFHALNDSSSLLEVLGVSLGGDSTAREGAPASGRP